MTVVLIASAIAIALAAIAGAIYVLWTGQVDVGALALIGISVPLLVFGLVWLGASGTLAAAVTWIQTVALPWVRGVLTTVLSWLAQRLSAALTWIQTVALPWVGQQISRFWRLLVAANGGLGIALPLLIAFYALFTAWRHPCVFGW